MRVLLLVVVLLAAVPFVHSETVSNHCNPSQVLANLLTSVEVEDRFFPVRVISSHVPSSSGSGS